MRTATQQREQQVKWVRNITEVEWLILLSCGLKIDFFDGFLAKREKGLKLAILALFGVSPENRNFFLSTDLKIAEPSEDHVARWVLELGWARAAFLDFGDSGDYRYFDSGDYINSVKYMYSVSVNINIWLSGFAVALWGSNVQGTGSSPADGAFSRFSVCFRHRYPSPRAIMRSADTIWFLLQDAFVFNIVYANHIDEMQQCGRIILTKRNAETISLKLNIPKPHRRNAPGANHVMSTKLNIPKPYRQNSTYPNHFDETQHARTIST